MMKKCSSFISNDSSNPEIAKETKNVEKSNLYHKIISSEWIVCQNISIKRSRFFNFFRRSSKHSQSEYILYNANAFFQINQLNCILGPSGCGKSTLIRNCFGHLQLLQSTQGLVQVLKKPNSDHLNPIKKTPKESCMLISFVPQHVQLYEVLTVAENFSYAFEFKYTSKEFRQKAFKHFKSIENDQNDLKINQEPTSKEKLKSVLISSVLQQLGILHISQNKVHSCSGGEKKRVAIGLELICPSDLIVLDEPTTGLDSAVSMQLITYLRKLCTCLQVTVLAIIHQPSFELFLKFHNAYVMGKNGHCLYSGRSDMLLKYVQAHGMTCPKFYNPADFILDLAQGDFGDKVLKSMRQHQQKAASAVTKLEKLETHKLDEIRYRPRHLSTKQVMLLAKQWIELNIKDRSLVRMQIFTYVFGPLMLSFALNQKLAKFTGCPPFHLMSKNLMNLTQMQSMTQEDWDEFEFSNDHLHLQNIAYLRQFNNIQLTELMGFVSTFFVYDALFGYSVVTLAGYSFPAQLQLFLNQRLNGFFSLSSYLVSKTFSDIPLLTIYCLLTSLVIYVTSGYSLIVPFAQWIDPEVHKKQFCDRLFGNKTSLYGISSSINKFDQTQDIAQAAEFFELESQSELLLRFFRYYISNMAIILTAQTNGMIIGALLFFSLNAAVFFSPISLIPHYLFAEVFKDTKIQHNFWKFVGRLSPIRNGIRMQVLSIYTDERCQLLQRQCAEGGDFFTNHELMKQWLFQQFGLNRGNVSSGISDAFVNNLLDLIYGDYMGNKKFEISPQPLKQFNIAEYTYEENVPLVYGEMLVYRIILFFILFWKGSNM